MKYLEYWYSFQENGINNLKTLKKRKRKRNWISRCTGPRWRIHQMLKEKPAQFYMMSLWKWKHLPPFIWWSLHYCHTNPRERDPTENKIPRAVVIVKLRSNSCHTSLITWIPSLNPTTEWENQLLKVVPWPTHLCSVMYTPPTHYPYIHNNNNNNSITRWRKKMVRGISNKFPLRIGK